MMVMMMMMMTLMMMTMVVILILIRWGALLVLVWLALILEQMVRVFTGRYPPKRTAHSGGYDT